MISFETRNENEATQRLAGLERDAVRFERCESEPDFALRVKAVKLGACTLLRADVVNCRVVREIRDSVVINLALRGEFYSQAGRQSDALGPARRTGVARPYQTYAVSIPRGAGLALILPVERLVARAEELADRTLGDHVIGAMADDIDLRAPAARALARTMKIAIAEASELSAAGLLGLVASGYEDLLSRLAAACLFPHILGAEAHGGAEGGPRAIRRARDYIRDHAAAPLDMSRLASRLGVSMRTLQENFRRYYGTSPREFLIECRLERARQRLLAAGGGDSVTLIAVEAGFGDMGYFSAKYREKFGELPSETLRAARR
jgi:AraC-like DNA-binding protein